MYCGGLSDAIVNYGINITHRQQLELSCDWITVTVSALALQNLHMYVSATSPSVVITHILGEHSYVRT